MTNVSAINIHPSGPAFRWNLTKAFCFIFSIVAGIFFFSFVSLFVAQSIPVWKHAGISYVTEGKWFFRSQQFGLLAMLYGTIVVALIAILVAMPIGIGAAIFTSEYLQPYWRLAFKIIIELLAGIPSVVYGLLGILLLRDWVYHLLTRFDPLSGDTLLTAGLLLGVMVLPTIMTLADDSFRSVPNMQRVAARGLGLTRTEAVLHVVVPQAKSGLISAALLGLGRSLGETIAVFLVVGRQDNQFPDSLVSLRPLIEAGQTLTSKLGGSETNIAYGDPLHWAAIVGLGLVLLVIVGFVTWIGAWREDRRRA